MPGADLARALGIVAIVVGHVITTDWAYRLIFTWHVPLFFFLSGVFWREDRNFRADWRARERTLIRPYIAWLTFISVFAIPMAIYAGRYALVRRLGSIALGGTYLKTPYTAFWFFSCLFASCLACRLARERKVSWGAIALIGLSATFVGPVLRFVPLAIGTAVPCLVFIAAGKAYSAAPRVMRAPLFGIAALGAGLFAIFAGVDRPLFIKNGDFGVPIVGVVVAVLICWGLLSVLSSVPLGRPGRRLSTAVATYGSAVILAHGLPLDWFYGRGDGAEVLAAVVLATGLMVAVAARLPWRGALLGA